MTTKVLKQLQHKGATAPASATVDSNLTESLDFAASGAINNLMQGGAGEPILPTLVHLDSTPMGANLSDHL